MRAAPKTPGDCRVNAHGHTSSSPTDKLHGADGGHNHAVSADADVKYLRIALALIVGFMAVEVVVAVLAK